MLPLQVLDDLKLAERIAADAEPGQQLVAPFARQDSADTGSSFAVAHAVDRQRGADIICAFNFSICLLHARSVKADSFKPSCFRSTPQILPHYNIASQLMKLAVLAAGQI